MASRNVVLTLPPIVPYDELDGSPLETYGLADFHVEQRLRCAWGSRLLLADQFLSCYTVTIGTDCDGNTVYSRMGSPYAYWPGIYAYNVAIKPFGQCTSVVVGAAPYALAGYPFAELTISYRPFAFNPGTGFLIAEEAIRESAETLNVPTSQLVWTDAKNVMPEERSFLMLRTMEWTLRYWQLNRVPSCWWDAAGCVNSDTVQSPQLGKTFDPETLLYHGPDATRVVGPSGGTYWNVALRFSYRTYVNQSTGLQAGLSWNKFFRSLPPNSSPATFTNPDYMYVANTSGSGSSLTKSAGAALKPYPGVAFGTTFFLP